MGSLGSGRARRSRVQRLEQAELETSSRVEPSQIQLEVWALDAEIRILEQEIIAAGGEPHDEWRRGDPLTAGMSLDEEIAALEAELSSARVDEEE